MKNALSCFCVFGYLLCINAFAQNEAILNYYGAVALGYAENGAGFIFIPSVSIEVTALGFNGDDLATSPYQVSLYNQNGSRLATATITTGSTLYNQTYYQSIAPVILPAFSTNYIGGG